MAKQKFTTGQVLTAAQMTSLQQTAMGGGSPVTKTASYVLVAADAGTVIQMNSASATTITVNTGLFASGDTVEIQNIGAGVCTITAGTATVTTAGSLALTQWEGGQLYFTSTSAAIFFDYIQTGASLPLTTKGDVLGYNTAAARIPIGTDGQVLTADSTQSLGLKWATSAAGGGGKVLQVVYASYSTTTSTTSTSYSDTGLTANITPSATSSKVLVLVTHPFTKAKDAAGNGGIQIMRGSTTLIASNGLGYTETASYFDSVHAQNYLDSPSTTSSTTYKTQLRSGSSGVNFEINPRANSAATITLIEIGA
jgi:hypothetical protein